MNCQTYFAKLPRIAWFGGLYCCLSLCIVVLQPSVAQSQVPGSQRQQTTAPTTQPTYSPAPQFQRSPNYGQPYQVIQQQYPTYQQPYPPAQQYPPPVQQYPPAVLPTRHPTNPASQQLSQSQAYNQQLTAKLQQQLKIVTESNRKLEYELRSLRRTPGAAQAAQADQWRSLVNKQKQQIETISARNQQLESELTSLQQSSRRVQSDDSMQQKLEELRASLAAQSDERLAELNSELEVARLELQESANSLGEQRNVNLELQNQIDTLRQSNQSSQSTDDQQLADLRKQAELFQNENVTLVEQLNQLQESQQNQGQQLIEAKTQNQQLRQELQQAQSQFDGLNNTNARLEEQLTLAPSIPSDPVAVNVNNTPSFDDSGLRNQLVAANQLNERLERRANHSRLSLNSLKAENESLRQEIESKPELSAANVATVPAVEATGILASTSVAPGILDETIAVDTDEATSGGSSLWPVKYWVLGLMLIGLSIALFVAWAEGGEAKKSRQTIAN